MIDVRPSQDTRDLRPSASLNSQANDPVPFIVYPPVPRLCLHLLSLSLFADGRPQLVPARRASRFATFRIFRHAQILYLIFRINFPIGRQIVNFHRVSHRRFFRWNYFIDRNDVWSMHVGREERVLYSLLTMVYIYHYTKDIKIYETL